MKRFITLFAVFALTLTALASCAKKTEPDYLVLVNKDHPISEDYIKSVTLCDIYDVESGGTLQVEKKTYEAFEALSKELKEHGVEIGVNSAYRSVEEQQRIMDDFTEKYGKEYAEKTVAIPGTSEHHTGLSVDIVPKVNGEWVIENEDMMKEITIFEKVHAYLPEYGFILRYPEGKEDITGYEYAPWALRYVGVEAAKEITEKGLTLEEYVASK